ncbi:MAG: class A beta-lactamase, subclass A2 [Bacteroidota bacterium]
MSKLNITITLITLTFCINITAAQIPLGETIKRLSAPAKATVGVAVLSLEGREAVSINGNKHLVMQSVMKFPIAITVLHQVDIGKLKLDQSITITKADLPPTYSPLRDKYPEGGVSVPISELLSYMVSQSDNNACDILLRVLGGTVAVRNYLKALNINDIAVNASESEMAAAWQVQYNNWCTPNAMVNLLDKFYHGKTLSKNGTAFLMRLLAATSTGPKQIKGLLPAATIVAHKTGRSATNAAGLSPATNDIGIIALPNHKHLAIAIFVYNATADLPVREEVIAKIAKAAYDESAAR